ncbi:MAG: succinate dehydrogenase iron-sulfur subunit [Bacillota bacterium]|jgi:succinate dehydrogenase / fumarate reductase iron-sulfur subunit
MTNVRFSVRRQRTPQDKSYVEHFQVTAKPQQTVISLLTAIDSHPYNEQGARVEELSWEASCLEEICGSCSMVINGVPRQACTALVDRLQQPITIEPLTSFPVMRDLLVDRSRMFETLAKVQAWIDIDGLHHPAAGPRQDNNLNNKRYQLSQCMTCGLCLEACPNVKKTSKFQGPFAAAQVELFNSHPVGEAKKEERIANLFNNTHLAACSNAQNCSRACPKGIPLLEAIAKANWAATKLMAKKFLKG